MYNPTLHDVFQALQQLRDQPGQLRLELLDPRHEGAQSPSLSCDQDHYLLMLAESSEEGDDVRTLTARAFVGQEEKVYILGDPWDRSLLTSEYSLVQKRFEDFYRTGDVSTEVLR